MGQADAAGDPDHLVLRAVITIPHSPYEPECSTIDHCHVHNVDEPADGAYRICGECGHVYMSEQELVDGDAEWHGGVRRPVAEIYVCVHCPHDLDL